MKDKDNRICMQRKSEQGIAIMLALSTLLIISIMAVSIAFVSNTDFQTMSNYKAGEESFLAAESCVVEARKKFEIEGIETLVALQTIGEAEPFTMVLPNGSVCRSGPRFFINNGSNTLPFINIPEGVKSIERPLKDTMLPSGGKSAPVAAALDFEIVGKHSGDRDKDDKDSDLNTGTQISVGIETFLPSGGSNVYSN